MDNNSDDESQLEKLDYEDGDMFSMDSKFQEKLESEKNSDTSSSGLRSKFFGGDEHCNLLGAASEISSASSGKTMDGVSEQW